MVRTRSIVWCAAIFALGALPPALLVAQDSGGPNAEPRRLVEKLGDPSYAVREGAFRKLAALGKGAEEAAKQGTEHPNAEVRRRCQSLLAIIGRPAEDRRWEDFIAKKTDKGPAGWETFRETAGGDDPESRTSFVKMHQADAELLDMLAKDKSKVASMISSRTMNLQQKIVRMQQEGAAFDPFPSFLAIMHAAVASNAKVDLNGQYQICNLFHQHGISQPLRQSSLGKKLMGKWLIDCTDPQVQRNQAPYLASNFGLIDVIQTKLRPIADELVKDATKNPEDMNKFYQAINMCQVLRLTDVLESQMKPMVRTRLEAAAKETSNLNRIVQAANCAQALQMQAEASAKLRPAAAKFAGDLVKDNLLDQGRINQLYTVLNLARTVQAPEIIDDILRPAGQRALFEASARTSDINQMFQMIGLAQNLELQDLTEPLLKPAAQRVVRKLIQDKQLNSLQQAQSLTQQMSIRLDDLDKAIREHAVDSVEKRLPLAQVQQAVQMARQAGGDPATDKKIEAGLGKLFADLVSKPIQANDVYQGIQMAREWNLKEGLEFALKAAQSPSVPIHARGQALAYVAQTATKEVLPKLESMLDDRTSFGRTSINALSLETQMRDAALLTMVVISNQNVDDYGFAFARAFRGQNPAHLPPNWWGFQDDAGRTRALERWREHRKKG